MIIAFELVNHQLWMVICTRDIWISTSSILPATTVSPTTKDRRYRGIEQVEYNQQDDDKVTLRECPPSPIVRVQIHFPFIFLGTKPNQKIHAWWYPNLIKSPLIRIGTHLRISVIMLPIFTNAPPKWRNPQLLMGESPKIHQTNWVCAPPRCIPKWYTEFTGAFWAMHLKNSPLEMRHRG